MTKSKYTKLVEIQSYMVKYGFADAAAEVMALARDSEFSVDYTLMCWENWDAVIGPAKGYV